MPATDKDVYLKIHARLEQILEFTLANLKTDRSFDKCLTLGFSPSGGVRGNRPKDLWCAIFPRGAAAYMPQVYLIVSHRGVELGFAAAIHPSDFSNQDFKLKLKSLAPRIFDALPSTDSAEIKTLAAKLANQGGWYFRRKTRLAPKENDFGRLEDLIDFLKSAEGKSWGAGTVTRYWLPHEVAGEIDLAKEFLNAATLFTSLLVKEEREEPSLRVTSPPIEAPATTGTIRADLERFMEMYPERRARPFATDKELWSVISSLQQQIKSLPAVARRPTVHVTWSVGQGNWARVPWIAFLDSRITDSTQRGVYGVFLFREDMSGVYLTFNQGVTEPKRIHGATSGLQLLRENATKLRTTSVDLEQRDFRLDGEIDLRTDGTLGRDYEAATIAYKFYQRGEVPEDADIIRDIEALLVTYEEHIAPKGQRGFSEPGDDARPLPPSPPYLIDEALPELFLEREELEELLILWRTKKNIILQGPPGVGKSFIAKRLGYLLMGHRDQARMRTVQFHQAYSYEDFIQGYRPSEEGGFIRRDGAFFDFAKLAEADPDRPYVFIVDEINRGNLSKILGELMMLIENDKRGREYALPLAYSRPDEAPFSVPPNLFLIGLMNTADRSLAMVDYALRRRFGFHALEPKFDSQKFKAYLINRKVPEALVKIIIERVSQP